MKLPLKHRKDILKFCVRYEKLCAPRDIKIKITVPKAKYKVNVRWDSDDKISINESEYIPDSMEFFYNSTEIKKINRDIKRFIKDTEKWGRKYFKEKDWLWYNVLWNYRPECNETAKERLKINWI